MRLLESTPLLPGWRWLDTDEFDLLLDRLHLLADWKRNNKNMITH